MKTRFFLGIFGWLFAFGVSGWTADADLAYNQAWEAISKVGGRIEWDDSNPMKPFRKISFSCHSHLTDAQLPHFQHIPDLQEVALVGEKVTDKGMESLRSLSKLTSLRLNCTSVTDKGLEHLKGLTHLQKVHIRYSNCTEDGIKKLAKALPNAQITHIPHPWAR